MEAAAHTVNHTEDLEKLLAQAARRTAGCLALSRALLHRRLLLLTARRAALFVV